MTNIVRLVQTLLSVMVLSFATSVQANLQPASALENNLKLDLNLVPSIVEAGQATYAIGYVRLISNSTGEPVIAPSDLEVGLLSADASIAFVPSRIVIPAGDDYARFNVEVTQLTGETQISALYGNQIVSKNFKVVDAISLVGDVNLVINLPSDKMQVGSEIPFSVYLESNGNILQAPEDILVKFDYESSLVELNSHSAIIKKGEYYALGTIKTIEKSGNAFIKATAEANVRGQLYDTVRNIVISQTQPVSLKTYVFPERVGLKQTTIDMFIGLLDASGNPTIAPQDIKLELFSSSTQLSSIASTPAVIKKGEFGFYTRQPMNFYQAQTVTLGASMSGLGASTASFKILEDFLTPGHPKAQDRVIKVFTIPNMPSDTKSIVVYQLNAIEHDLDDVDCNHNKDFLDDGNDCNQDKVFDTYRDTNKDGIIDKKDWHPIDDLTEGELYPIDSLTLYSTGQGNLNVVSANTLAAKIIDAGSVSSGSSYGTAMIQSGRQPDNTAISASLATTAVGSNAISIVAGLNPVKTKIFSPAGVASDGNYRLVFDHKGRSDLFFVTLDPSGRPSNSEQGVKYLVKPVNELVEIAPGKSFASIIVKTDSFRAPGVTSENIIKEISATPVGINAISNLEEKANLHLLFNTGTTTEVLLPFDSIVAFSKTHKIGVVQLRDSSGKPIIASDDILIKLSSSSLSSVLSAPAVTIPKGKSFAGFEVATFGRADNFTIFAEADGFQSSSAIMAPVVAEMPASFIGTNKFEISVPNSITVSTPISGAIITWGASAGLQLLGNATSTFDSISNSHTATIHVMSDKAGTFTVDATLLKDGFKPTRISKEVVVGPYQRSMNAILVGNGALLLAYNQPALMQVLVKDASGLPVQGARIQVEDSGPMGMTLVASAISDSSGIATFIYTPMQKADSSNIATLVVTASKDGYQPSSASKVFEIDSSTAFLPPIPIIGNAFTGLPSWASYAVLGGIAAIGGGFYLLRKPKSEEDDEPITEETSATEEQKELIEQPLEDTTEEEEDEET